MKHKFLLKTMLLLSALIAGSGNVWGQTTVTDELTASDFAATGTTYTGFSNVSKTSDAVYAGQSAKDGSGNIQLRSKNSNSGIVSTTSGGTVKSVKITVGSGSNTIDVYGSNTAYTAASDLYGNNKGTKIGSTSSTGTITFPANTDYQYVGIRSNSGAIYLSKVEIEWTVSGDPTTFTVTYDANGGTGSDFVDDNTGSGYASGTTVTVLANDGNANFTNAGYTFGGWNTETDGSGDDYDEGDTFEITDDVTLYAQWTAKTITGLSYEGTPTKTTYYAGENFNPAGLTVTATFDDTSSEDVTASVSWTPAPLTEGTTSVTGTYMGQTINITGLTVTVAPGSTAENAYTVAQAIAAIDDAGKTTITNKYVRGIVSQVDNYNSKYNSITYWISDDGTTTNQFEVYSGLSFEDGTAFSSKDDIQKGDVVVVKGDITYYTTSSVYEFNMNSHLVSQKLVAPTFYPVEGAVGSGTELTISDAHTDATIYYTTDGSTPTTSSTAYNTSSKPTITAATTFKAIAVKTGDTNDNFVNSDVASASYTILTPVETPVITLAGGTYSSAQSTTITCATEGATIYYTTDGTAPTTSSTEYTGAISINESMTIKAIAAKEGMANSAVATATYTISIPAITITAATPVNVIADGAYGELELSYENFVVSNANDFAVQFYDENDEVVSKPDWIAVDVEAADPSGYEVVYVVEDNSGAARTTYFKVFADAGADFVYSNKVTITQAAYVAPPTIGNWALATAGLADINSNDVFVIVGNNGETYAMTNDNGTSAPTAAEVAVVSNTLSGTIASNLQWNLGSDDDGYIFYPNGSTETWLYCTNSNDGVRVGTGSAKHFSIEDGYLTTKETSDQRYIGVYNSSDWRCYKKSGSPAVLPNNIKDQTFAFYKKLAAKLNDNGYATFSATVPVDFSDASEFSAWVITSISGSTITFEQVTGAVPANTGVLLKGEANKTVYPTATASGTDPGTNLLTAFATTTAVSANAYYGLSGSNFVKVKAGNIPAGKALLSKEAVEGSGVKAFTFVFEDDDATGVETIENGQLTNDNEIYDLQGRRVQKPSKGLYIVNGKKVLF